MKYTFNTLPFTKFAFDEVTNQLSKIQESEQEYLKQSLVGEYEEILDKTQNHDYMNLGDVCRVFHVLNIE